QGAAEDEGEAQHVVDLVRVVRTAGGHDHVVAGGVGQLRGDFRIRVGAGEHHRVGRHALETLGAQQVRTGQANEHVGAFQGVVQGALVGLVGKHRLVLVQIVAAGVDHALAVDHEDVLHLGAHADQELHAGGGGGTGAQADDLRLFQGLAGDFQRVEHARGGNDGGTVLVVMEHR